MVRLYIYIYIFQNPVIRRQKVQYICQKASESVVVFSIWFYLWISINFLVSQYISYFWLCLNFFFHKLISRVIHQNYGNNNISSKLERQMQRMRHFLCICLPEEWMTQKPINDWLSVRPNIFNDIWFAFFSIINFRIFCAKSYFLWS